MAMIDPSIDVLKKKAKGNAYVLCNVISKRAKEIQNTTSDIDPDHKEIAQACEEIAEGKIVPGDF